MCLIAFSVFPDARHALILAGNRDEFHARPTATLSWWSDKPDILGGRDLEAGGTWLATSRSGRFAAVTNSRDAVPREGSFRSRGLLITDFLESDGAPLDFLAGIHGDLYAGFNLIAGDRQSVAYTSNRDGEARELAPGTYALSNAVLDTPWHKVEYARQALQSLQAEDRLSDGDLFELLADRTRADPAQVDNERLPFELAHAITAPFIAQTGYGTRSSSILRVERGGAIRFSERNFDENGSPVGESLRSFYAE